MSKNFPALAAALVQAVITALMGFGLFHLSAGTVGAVEAVAAAAAGLWVAAQLHEGFPAAALGFVNALLTVLIAFKAPHFTPATVSAVDAVIVAVFAMFTHAASTPKTRVRERRL